MDPVIKAQWVEALRSGEYEQGNGRLHYRKDGEIKHCCLGVLCDLAVKSGLEVEVNPPEPAECKCGDHPPNPDSSVDGPFYYDGYDDFLPDAVMEWAGLHRQNPRIDDGEDAPEDETATLSWRNDNNSSFREIADIIEQNF